MSAPAFTVLLPVVRPPDLLPMAMASVLAQRRADLELFVVCDGAPPGTVAAAEAARARDPRVRVFPFSKGERHGEAHRHAALAAARGRLICHISDDDLWFPDHLDEMARLLDMFEFGNVLHAVVTANGQVNLVMADLADPAVRQRMLAETFNIFGPTVAGYRFDAYRRLPIGWSPAPEGIWTDLFMWRKFLAMAEISAGTRFAVTSLHFPTPVRKDWSPDRRREEMARYAAMLATDAGCDRLRQEILLTHARQSWRRTTAFNAAREKLNAAHEQIAGIREVLK